jgi:hypothetical protein
MKMLFLFSVLLAALSVNAAAQGVREPAKQMSPTTQTTGAATVDSQMSKPPAAPQSFAARYEGGMFGYSEKVKGTVHFDDVNKRLVFRNDENKEIFGLPYRTILVVEASSRKYTPTGAAVASAIPLPGAGLLGLISSKNQYLVIQFSDPDSNVAGGASFKVANKELLHSVIYGLGEKAELKQRGDAFYRPLEAQKPVL